MRKKDINPKLPFTHDVNGVTYRLVPLGDRRYELQQIAADGLSWQHIRYFTMPYNGLRQDVIRYCFGCTQPFWSNI